jgi:hypothetical protein
MREKVILSKTHLNKSEFLDLIESLGKKYNFRVQKEHLYNLDDINFYLDKDEKSQFFIGFQLISKEKFGRDLININGEDYANFIFITHDAEIIHEVNIIIKELLTTYPELRVTSETYKNYFSIEDINSGNVDSWLLE